MTDKPMSDTRTLKELLEGDYSGCECGTNCGWEEDCIIQHLGKRLRAIKAEVESNMSSRENYTLEALSNTILRIQRILF